MEWIDPKRLTIGCVVRPVYNDGSLPSFYDSVVLGIYVSYSRLRTIKKNEEREYFLTLSEAQAAADSEDWVVVKLGRPMLYADNEFVSTPSWAFKCEVYEVVCPQIVDGYKVVVMGNGEYDIRNIKPPIQTFSPLNKTRHLSEEARAARAPRPPEELVGALQDRIHPTSGRLLAAKPIATTRRK